MVESSDLQSAIQRTQAMERVASLQNQQEELNRKRFELEMARQSAEKARKTQNVDEAESKRVVRDRYDGDGAPPEEEERAADGQGEEQPHDEEGRENGPALGGSLDVRV